MFPFPGQRERQNTWSNTRITIWRKGSSPAKGLLIYWSVVLPWHAFGKFLCNMRIYLTSTSGIRSWLETSKQSCSGISKTKRNKGVLFCEPQRFMALHKYSKIPEMCTRELSVFQGCIMRKWLGMELVLWALRVWSWQNWGGVGGSSPQKTMKWAKITS